MPTFLALAVAVALPADPFAGYLAFVRAHPSFKVDVVSKINGTPGTEATLLIQKPGRMLYKSRDAKTRYSVSDTEKGYLEIEHSDKVYDEFDYQGRIGLYSSDINSRAIALFPSIVLTKDLRDVFRGKPDITAKGPDQTIHEQDKGSTGVADTWVTINPAGEIIYARRFTKSPMGQRDLEWTFSGYSFPRGLTLKSFLTPLPLGYVPNSVQRLPEPLQAGKKAPLDGWVGPTGSKKKNLLAAAGNKPFLIACLAPDSAPSSASRASLARLKARLPVYIVGDGGLRDPDGSRLKVLNPAAWPMFYLIGANGKVAKLWLGYSPAEAAKFEADVLAGASR